MAVCKSCMRLLEMRLLSPGNLTLCAAFCKGSKDLFAFTQVFSKAIFGNFGVNKMAIFDHQFGNIVWD